jgi:hypothetical protein
VAEDNLDQPAMGDGIERIESEGRFESSIARHLCSHQ